MGKLTELEQWDEDVYQIETSDPVLGGPEGITNKPAKQLANRTQWLKKRLEDANNALAEHEKSRNHPDATLTDKGFVRLYSGVTSMDETMAATPKAVKIAMDNANARLAKERNLADLTNIPLARQSLHLGNSATLNVGTTPGTVAAGDDSRITGAMQKAQNGADIPNKPLFVQNLGLTETVNLAKNAAPSTRKVNGHALTQDINVTSQDIFNTQAIGIGPNQNLDDYQTPGLYSQGMNANTSAALHYPENTAGTLMVLKNAGVTQVYYVYGSSRVWTRSKYATAAWTPWAREYNTENPPPATNLSAYATTTWVNQQLIVRDNNINTRATIAWVNQNFPSSMRWGGIVSTATVNAASVDAPAGSAVVGVTLDTWGSRGTHVTYIRHRPFMKLINGAWKVIDTW